MQFEDTTQVDTPEGVQLELTLAGLGSRIGAQLLDSLLKALVVLVALFFTSGSDASLFVLFVILPIVVIGYEIYFETRWSGQTPGKRAFKLRVRMADGSRITFTAAVVRNLLRVVDALPGAYAVGAILVFSTKNAQRLGDLAAGTVVIKEPQIKNLPTSLATKLAPVPPGFDATGIAAEHVALARAFLIRRYSLTEKVRRKMAYKVAINLRHLVHDPTGSMTDEEIIESVVAAKTRSDGPS